MTLKDLNELDYDQRRQVLFNCCGSTMWSQKLAHKSPFNSIQQLKHQSDLLWKECTQKDFLEAFSHHPKIGDRASLEKKFPGTAAWASGEQAAVNVASQDILSDLKLANEVYENRFGYIFIVCATGKSAKEMLELLNQRLSNSSEQEIKIAAEEQNKITHIRIDKLFL
jgi:2-oxo-4-hydroxy-4-carboxy-5-ureidoimidazoline decarboxylase